MEQIFAYDLRLLMRASSFGEKAGGSRKQELIDFEGDKIDYVSCVTIKRLQICEVRGNKSWSHSKQKSYNMASCNEVVVHRIDATRKRASNWKYANRCNEVVVHRIDATHHPGGHCATQARCNEVVVHRIDATSTYCRHLSLPAGCNEVVVHRIDATLIGGKFLGLNRSLQRSCSASNRCNTPTVAEGDDWKGCNEVVVHRIDATGAYRSESLSREVATKL